MYGKINKIVDKSWGKVKKHYEAWWNCEVLERVPLWVVAPRNGCQVERVPKGSLDKKLFNKGRVIEQAERDIKATFYGGLAFPCYWPNFGTDVFAAYLGADLKFTPDSSTVSWADWSKPVLKDYSDLSILQIKDDNFYWQKTKELTSYALKQSRGSYLVGITDIHASIDALAVLRGGPEQLCVDLIENPRGVKEAMKYLWKAWYKVYNECYQIIRESQEGTCTWIGFWSPGKTYSVQNDFSCLISPSMYEEFFLEELVNEINYLDHSIYHLDGPDALKHLDLILDIPRLNAVQWVAGAAQIKEGVAKWISLYRKIQAKKKAVVVYCQPDEVDFVLENLAPEGLLIAPMCSSEGEAVRLLSEKESIKYKV